MALVVGVLVALLTARGGGETPESAATDTAVDALFPANPDAADQTPTDADDPELLASDGAAAETAVRTALLAEATALLDEGEAERALDVVDTMLDNDPEDPDALALRGRATRALEEEARRRAESALLADVRAADARPVDREIRRQPAPPGNLAIQRTDDGSIHIGPQQSPPPVDVASLWRDARRARDDKRYHTLRDLLDRILAADPGDREARSWRDDVGDWIEDREDDLRDEVDDLLDELADAFDDRDRSEIASLWGSDVDRRTLDYFDRLWSRYPATDARYSIVSIEARDDHADFVAVLTLRGKERKGFREKYQMIEQVRWSGRLVDDRSGPRFASPFP